VPKSPLKGASHSARICCNGKEIPLRVVLVAVSTNSSNKSAVMLECETSTSRQYNITQKLFSRSTSLWWWQLGLWVFQPKLRFFSKIDIYCYFSAKKKCGFVFSGLLMIKDRVTMLTSYCIHSSVWWQQTSYAYCRCFYKVLDATECLISTGQGAHHLVPISDMGTVVHDGDNFTLFILRTDCSIHMTARG